MGILDCESVEEALQQRLEEAGGALAGTHLQIVELEQQVRLPISSHRMY